MRQNTPQAGDHHRRHVFIWKLLLLPMRLLLRIRFNHTAQPADVKGPFLFVCNHCTDWDPMLAGSSFSQQIYFVTSEHILRVRLAGALIRWLQDPIPRQKGGSAADTVHDHAAAAEERVQRRLVPGREPQLGRDNRGISAVHWEAGPVQRRVAGDLPAGGRILFQPPLGRRLPAPGADDRACSTGYTGRRSSGP